jgi:hypothetical protein
MRVRVNQSDPVRGTGEWTVPVAMHDGLRKNCVLWPNDTTTFRECPKRRTETISDLRCRAGTSSPFWIRKKSRFYLSAVATWEIFRVTPSGNGLSPVLNAVPKLSNSHFETFSIETSGVAATTNLSA